MKKTVIILGAFLLFGNASIASNSIIGIKKQVKLSVYEESPLHFAISKGDLETVKKCLAYGADVNKIVNNMTPLMVAARFNQIEIIKILLEKGARPLIENAKGLTALDYAEYAKAFESVAILKRL